MNQYIHVSIVNKTTNGTKNYEMRSARPWIGALAFCAFSTNFIIWLSEEFSQVLVTFIIIFPWFKIEPPNNFEPDFFSTGLDSPVNMDSLQRPFPRITIPSTGTPWPGYTLI